uniref:Putative portal protein n=1 Tax=viral metagenome TaxID=1070528 RepID=A0A6M3LHH1_9ZZZZ
MAQSDEDKVKLVNNLFELARVGINPQRIEWLQRYKYWKAKNEIKRPKYKDNVRIPFVFFISDGIQSILTENPPKVQFLPQEEADVQTADNLNQVIGDYYWDKLKMFRISEEVIWWAMNISGSGLAKWGIDLLTGEFYIEALNSFACYPDPSAKSLETCEYFIYSTVKPLSIIKRTYGERAKDVKPQDELNEMKIEDDLVIAPWARTSGLSENLIHVLQDSTIRKDYARAMVTECWMRDEATEKIPFDLQETLEEHNDFRNLKPHSVEMEENHPAHLENHITQLSQWLDDDMVPSNVTDMLNMHIEQHRQEPQDTRRLKYPKGKIVTVSSNMLLDERPAPFGLATAKMDFILDPRQFWGCTLQEFISSLQESRERRKRQISDNADRMANLREFYLTNSGYDPDKTTGEPGEQIPVRMPGAVWQEQPSGLPTYILEDAADSERLMEKIAGFHEVMQGIYPKGSPSGISIASLQEAMGPRIRKASRHFEWFLIDCMRGLIEMLPYEDPTKVYFILGKQDMPIRLNHDELNLRGEYDIRVVAGSTLPTSRMEKFQKALQLRQLQVYDDMAVLKFLDDPQKEEIMQRKNTIQELININQALMEQNNMLKQQLGVPTNEQGKGQRQKSQGSVPGVQVG